MKFDVSSLSWLLRCVLWVVGYGPARHGTARRFCRACRTGTARISAQRWVLLFPRWVLLFPCNLVTAEVRRRRSRSAASRGPSARHKAGKEGMQRGHVIARFVGTHWAWQGQASLSRSHASRGVSHASGGIDAVQPEKGYSSVTNQPFAHSCHFQFSTNRRKPGVRAVLQRQTSSATYFKCGNFYLSLYFYCKTILLVIKSLYDPYQTPVFQTCYKFSSSFFTYILPPFRKKYNSSTMSRFSIINSINYR
jgi:hypothetical protein